jgi:hypothetical protein
LNLQPPEYKSGNLTVTSHLGERHGSRAAWYMGEMLAKAVLLCTVQSVLQYLIVHSEKKGVNLQNIQIS